MTNRVKIVECPRDAWQALPARIPAQQKAGYLQSLMSAGFTHIDAVSFVSPKAVPQMSDSEEVLQRLEIPEGTEIIGIVVNSKGAERAVTTGKVQTLGFPYSISPEFLRRNQNQSPQESLAALQSISAIARDAGLGIVAYLSMAFGNPYGDPWTVASVTEACAGMVDLGIQQTSLADTVGVASPQQVEDTVASAIAGFPGVELGVHLHARAQTAPAKIQAAWRAGCRRFDAAIGGLGGCPFAQDDLVGNIPTETLLAELKAAGAELPRYQALDALIQASASIAAECGNAGSNTTTS
jgi:hydroxymethylglutaryl-CoA lyase